MPSKPNPVIITRISWDSAQLISKVAEDEETENAQTWIKGTKPLYMASGHMISFLGHLRNDLSKAYLFTSWKDISSYEAFQASPDYSAYLTAISIHGPILSTQTADFMWLRNGPFELNGSGHMSLRTIHFESSISDDEKAAALMNSGYVTRISSSLVEGFAYSVSWRSWLKEESDYNGINAKSMIVAYWWKSWDLYDAYTEWREPEWPSSPMYNSDGTVAVQDTLGMTHTEVWNKRLLAKGSLGWEDEEIELLLFPMEPWLSEWQQKKRQEYEESWVYASC